MICESMKTKAKRNTERLLKSPIEDVAFFESIKKLPFFHINREFSLDSILRTGRIYSSRFLPNSLIKYHSGNTYQTDMNAGLDAYVFLSFATITDIGAGTPYGDLLMQFDHSIVDIPYSYFTPKDISSYESLWKKLHYDNETPMNRHRSQYIEQFYELHAIYHYFYHFLKRKGIHTIEQLLQKIYQLKIVPPEVKIYHSLPLDYLNNIFLIPGKNDMYYANNKRYKYRIKIEKTGNMLNLTHRILRKTFHPNFIEDTFEDKIDEIRKLILV